MKNNIYKKSINGRAKGVIGILLVVLAVAGIFLWENYGREAFTYASITVLNEDLEKGTVVTADMLRTIKIDQSNLIKHYIKNPDEVIGMQTTTFLPADLQLCKKFFMKQGLVTKPGEHIMALPKEWILTFPQTVRRGDTIYFYSVKNKEQYSINENGDVIFHSENEKKESIAEAKVAYVKDSAGREVVDVTPNRKDASAVISSIEVVINDAKYQILRDAVEAKNQFVISYR